jgi:DNA-binding CsgD family transcriptional regulator
LVELVERERELAAVEDLLQRRGGTLVVEGGMGLGKTALAEVACERADALAYEVLRSRGSELEREFPFGLVRQLFERRLVTAELEERDALLAGPAYAVEPLLAGSLPEGPSDRSFAVLHGLYWLACNLAASQPLLLVVDDGHWADDASLRWLAYLASRLEGLAVSLLVSTRPEYPARARRSLLALRREAVAVVRPGLLSEGAVGSIVRARLGEAASGKLCEAVWAASGGNPLYATELTRAVKLEDEPKAGLDPAVLLTGGVVEIGRRVIERVDGLDPAALRLAQALALLGDGAELRHAAAIAGIETSAATHFAARLVRIDVLAEDRPPRFVHPVVRDALEYSLDSGQRDGGHRAAARLLHDAGAPAGQVAAHLVGVAPAADRWTLERLREGARAAMGAGAPRSAADLMSRALAEPPARRERVEVLREAARAEVSAGSELGWARLEEALKLTTDPRQRAGIALEAAEAYAALFRWTEAVDVMEQALSELGDADDTLTGRLEGELVVAGLHDARRASRTAPVLARLSGRGLSGSAAEAVAVGQGMAMVLGGVPVEQAVVPLETAIRRADAGAENWDTRAALLWSLITAERFEAVEELLEPMLAHVRRSGSARGLVAAYSTLGFLKFRLGALPEADTASRLALRVLQDGDFAPGLPFAVTVLADVSTEAGELDEAEGLIALLPQEGWFAGVGTVLIPAARGRLRLAQGRAAEALRDFETCASMFSSAIWGTEMRDVGYLHARAGAVQALLLLEERERARKMADAELVEVRGFGAPRALGVALRAAGLAEGGSRGIELLGESVAVLRRSPALLERARSLTELGAGLRRAGRRAAARDVLGEALDLAAGCGARPLIARARDELRSTGARPRRLWRTGVEALTPSELRIVRLAGEGRSNGEIAHELYVTLKTVEAHLSRAYSKLGIERRGQLAGILKGENIRVPTL